MDVLFDKPYGSVFELQGRDWALQDGPLAYSTALDEGADAEAEDDAIDADGDDDIAADGAATEDVAVEAVDVATASSEAAPAAPAAPFGNEHHQSLTGLEIQEMRLRGVRGSKIVAALAGNSATFAKKTVFAQAKYILRKSKK